MPGNWKSLVRATRARNVLKYGKLTCEMCNRAVTESDSECDHTIPHARGGPDTLDNLRILCKPCHGRKSLMDRLGL